LPRVGPLEMMRKIGQPCWQCTVGGHITVISLRLDWVRKVEMEKGCGSGVRKQEGVFKSTSILGMNIRLHFYTYLNVSIIMADFQIGRT
jgi:hypothetical protein